MTDKAEMETARGPTEMAAVQSALRDSATGWDARRDGLNVIPERKIAPSASEPATDTGDNQAIAKYGPSLHPLPNALGDVPPNQLGQVSLPASLPGSYGRPNGGPEGPATALFQLTSVLALPSHALSHGRASVTSIG
jgi:hypothetical protein